MARARTRLSQLLGMQRSALIQRDFTRSLVAPSPVPGTPASAIGCAGALPPAPPSAGSPSAAMEGESSRLAIWKASYSLI